VTQLSHDTVPWCAVYTSEGDTTAHVLTLRLWASGQRATSAATLDGIASYLSCTCPASPKSVQRLLAMHSTARWQTRSVRNLDTTDTLGTTTVMSVQVSISVTERPTTALLQQRHANLWF
jgi:hypothetical protein